jgi:hypothetical protein
MVLAGSDDQSFAEEYIPLLLAAGKEAEAQAELDACTARAGSFEALSTPLLEAAARLALNRGDDPLLDRIFSIEQPHIREGKNTMVEIWMEREVMRLSGNGLSKAEAEKQILKAMASGALIPPREIDFRMYTRKKE